MKRYSMVAVNFYALHSIPSVEHKENPDGEWVKWKDVEYIKCEECFDPHCMGVKRNPEFCVE